MQIILINIGNTHTQLLKYTGTAPERAPLVIATADILKQPGNVSVLAEAPELPLLAACVVPAAAAALRQHWPERRILLAGAAMLPEVSFQDIDTGTLGADRIVNLAGGLSLIKPPFLVLDCGTAVTVEAVDINRQFRGGAILPGRQLLRRALHEHTAQLPLIELCPEFPSALGGNTRDAILAGTDLAITGAIEKLLSEALKLLRAKSCPILITGGDGPFFFRHLQDLNLIDAPNLTMLGLAAIARRYLVS